jgi:cytochrome c-type biogenesis protein CcmH
MNSQRLGCGGFFSVNSVFSVAGVFLLLLAAIASTAAREAPPAADDPVLEQRLMTLSAELRCLVCQNQSLADSHADLAVDLRNQIREQMRAGKSDAEIRAWLTQRYGDFVLYRPPVKASTVLLWFGPFVLLALAVALLVVYLRRRRREVSRPPLTDEERARAEALIHADPGNAS